jgi:hypothetical protein
MFSSNLPFEEALFVDTDWVGMVKGTSLVGGVGV